MDNRKIRKILQAWEKFMQDGTSPNEVRGIVADSWKRSQDYEIPAERSETRLAPEEELVQCRAKNSDLIEAAQPALEQTRILLADAKSMAILTDPSGVVIETVGDERSLDTARMMRLEHGGLWGEGAMGTNGIGTALAALQPVHIHGVEHFCSELQRWTCAATPIWHPASHELLGGSISPLRPKRSTRRACHLPAQLPGRLRGRLLNRSRKSMNACCAIRLGGGPIG